MGPLCFRYQTLGFSLGITLCLRHVATNYFEGWLLRLWLQCPHLCHQSLDQLVNLFRKLGVSDEPRAKLFRFLRWLVDGICHHYSRMRDGFCQVLTQELRRCLALTDRELGEAEVSIDDPEEGGA